MVFTRAVNFYFGLKFFRSIQIILLNSVGFDKSSPSAYIYHQLSRKTRINVNATPLPRIPAMNPQHTAVAELPSRRAVLLSATETFNDSLDFDVLHIIKEDFISHVRS